jgi:hypothetical protein
LWLIFALPAVRSGHRTSIFDKKCVSSPGKLHLLDSLIYLSVDDMKVDFTIN